MTFSAALTQLQTLDVTGIGVAGNLGATNTAPEPPDLPVLVIEDTSQPFIEGIKAWNVAADKSTLSLFIDHILLIEGIQNNTFETRWDNIILYLDRYAAAITADLTLNNQLVSPLTILVVARGSIFFRDNVYSGIKFRHFWDLRVP